MRNEIINKILTRATDFADTARSVVLIGEFGSGKSWLAKKIHNHSDRRNKPFLLLDCYTLEEEEARKNLFGHLSFTDNGVRINKGLLEQCRGGTLYLKGFDTFTEKLQLQIVKSVASGRTKHIGGQRTIPIDTCVILSINIDQFYNSNYKYNMIKTVLGRDHEKIFYPPLRHRRDEIPYLADTFLKDEFATRYSFASDKISPRAKYQCICYDWPGNVKQLKNAIEHAAIISTGNSIQPEHLPGSVRLGLPDTNEMGMLNHDANFKEAEKKLFKTVMRKVETKKDLAHQLGLDLKTIEEKIDQYGLNMERSS